MHLSLSYTVEDANLFFRVTIRSGFHSDFPAIHHTSREAREEAKYDFPTGSQYLIGPVINYDADILLLLENDHHSLVRVAVAAPTLFSGLKRLAFHSQYLRNHWSYHAAINSLKIASPTSKLLTISGRTFILVT